MLWQSFAFNLDCYFACCWNACTVNIWCFVRFTYCSFVRVIKILFIIHIVVALEFFFLFLINPADPKDSESFRPADMHHGMEVRLGLSRGPVCPSFIWQTFISCFPMLQECTIWKLYILVIPIYLCLKKSVNL